MLLNAVGAHVPGCKLARMSHHLATANRDLPQSAAFPPIGLLNILRSSLGYPQVGNTTYHGTSRFSLRDVVRHAG